MVDTKIKSLEKTILQLEKASSNPNGMQFRNVLSRNESKVPTLRKKLQSCKEENSDYDYSEISAQVEDVVSRYESLTTSGTSANAQRDDVMKKTYQFGEYVSVIESTPRKYLNAEDMQNYTPEDSRKILELAKGDRRGSLGRMKMKYDKALNMMQTSEFQDRVYKEIDFIYSGTDPQEVMVGLNRHLNTFDFLSENVFFDNVDLKKTRDYIRKLVSKKQAQQNSTLSNILVSDFHSKNLNKILFTSNLSLDPKTASEGDFRSSFTAGETIKAIAYLDNVYQKIYGRTNRPSFHLLGSTNSGKIVSEGFKKSEGANSYVTFMIVQDGASYRATKGDYPGTAMSMEYLSNLPPRAHNIKVELGSYMGYAEGDAEARDVIGAFTFDATNDSGLAIMKKNITSIRDKALASVALPKAGMKKASYESELVTLFNSIGWEEKFTKAIIGSTDFGYKKNYLDQVTGRTLQVYMVSKKPDGGCMYQDFTVIQEKVGASWASFKRLSTGSQVDLPCSKL